MPKGHSHLRERVALHVLQHPVSNWKLPSS
jgi:hypothetical protein